MLTIGVLICFFTKWLLGTRKTLRFIRGTIPGARWFPLPVPLPAAAPVPGSRNWPPLMRCPSGARWCLLLLPLPAAAPLPGSRGWPPFIRCPSSARWYLLRLPLPLPSGPRSCSACLVPAGAYAPVHLVPAGARWRLLPLLLRLPLFDSTLCLLMFGVYAGIIDKSNRLGAYSSAGRREPGAKSRRTTNISITRCESNKNQENVSA